MTDLLDGWEDGSVELPPPAGMSPERIKERTMEQIRQTKRPRRRMGVRLLACAALAAVFTVSAMAAYHLWGPGELFDPFFTLESAPLDDGQKELLDQIGATNLPPVTSNGVTLTPLAAIADEHTLYLRLRLEAPEGTVLPDMGEQEDHIAHGVGLVDADTGERLNWGMQKARFLPDDTPGDNSLELVFMLLGGPNGANWVDGTSKTLTITDLILCPREPEDAEKTYLEGEWSFSLDSFYQGKEVEINTIGAVRWDEETERMVTLEGLTRSPLAASYTISYPVEESWEFVDLQLELVYKDGSSVTIDGGGGKGSHGPDGQGGTDYFTGVRNFDAPLDLRELDHLQYGGCRLEILGEPRAVVEADTAGAVWYDETHQNTLVLEKLSFSSLSLTYRMHYDTPESATLADTGIRLVLDDGSEVWLNAGSKLEYPATFENASERCVRIEGEAFFEIKRDTCRPFCVELGDGECIRVLGTSFNVNAYAGNGRHVTTLVTGRIGYAASAGAEEVVLEPNQQVSRDLAAGTVAVSAVDASVYGAWKEGWLWFENESLPALAERLGRIYGIRVEVAARLGEYTFSGKIRQDRGVEYILNLLSETSDVICKVENGVMRLS